MPAAVTALATSSVAPALMRESNTRAIIVFSSEVKAAIAAELAASSPAPAALRKEIYYNQTSSTKYFECVAIAPHIIYATVPVHQGPGPTTTTTSRGFGGGPHR
eukprot:524-Pyramimonas_sp.AAC.4